MVASKKTISQYLALTKSFACNEFVISPRSKNQCFMLEWGIDFETAMDIVLGLKVCDYVKGPCADDKHLPDRNNVWVFGKSLRNSDGDEIEAYIKITHFQTGSGIGCLCISFHASERSLVYEFGGEQREVYLLP